MVPRLDGPASDIPLIDVDVPDTLNIKAAKFITTLCLSGTRERFQTFNPIIITEMNIYLLLYATIIRTGCQLKTRFASPSDHDTPPPPIDSLLTHKLTSIIDTGERHRLNVAEADCNFCRKLPVDLLLSPSSTSEAIGCDSSLSVDMLLDLFFQGNNEKRRSKVLELV